MCLFLISNYAAFVGGSAKYYFPLDAAGKEVGRKISRKRETEKQDRKIAPLSVPLLYQYHV